MARPKHVMNVSQVERYVLGDDARGYSQSAFKSGLWNDSVDRALYRAVERVVLAYHKHYKVHVRVAWEEVKFLFPSCMEEDYLVGIGADEETLAACEAVDKPRLYPPHEQQDDLDDEYEEDDYEDEEEEEEDEEELEAGPPVTMTVGERLDEQDTDIVEQTEPEQPKESKDRKDRKERKVGMTPYDEMIWAKDELGKYRQTRKRPTKFPSDGCYFYFDLGEKAPLELMKQITSLNKQAKGIEVSEGDKELDTSNAQLERRIAEEVSALSNDS